MKRPPVKVVIAILTCAVLVAAGIFGLTLTRQRQHSRQALRIPPGALTERDFLATVRQWHMRTTLEAYIQVGEKSDAWNGDVMRLLEGYVGHLMEQHDAPTLAHLTGQARLVIHRGCADPLILSVYGDLLSEQGNHSAAIPHLRRAVAAFAQSRYPRMRAQHAPLLLAGALSMAPAKAFPGESASMQRLAVQWTVAAMCDGSFRPGEQRIALYLLERRQALGDAQTAELLAALQAQPTTDRYLVQVLHARQLLREALSARAEASPVALHTWHTKLREARALLMAAYKRHPQYPEAPAALIAIVREDASLGGSPRQWFERAVAAQCDYAPAYRELIATLLPSGGGSDEQVYRFGVECLQTARYETRVPFMFYTALQAIRRESKRDHVFRQHPGIPALLETMFAGYEKHARPEEQPRYQSLHAATAWYYGEYEQAMRLLDKLGDRVDRRAFTEDYAVDFVKARDEIYTKAPPCGPLMAQAEKLYRDKGAAAARAEYERIRAHGGWSPYLTHRLASRIAVLKLEEQWKTGGWMSLLPGPGVSGWTPLRGAWRLEPDGTLIGIADENGDLFMQCTARFPACFELRAEVELLSSHDANDCGAPGFFLGNTTDGAGSPDEAAQVSYTIAKEGNAVLRHLGPPDRTFITRIPAKSPHLLRLQVRDQKITTYVNGHPVHRSVRLSPTTLPASVSIGLGAVRTTPGDTIQIRKLQLHRLGHVPDQSSSH